ncbi:glycosyltransferase family A protein [Nocardioides sp.]|uniref:glycosyltransferase family 2 protein n=1 Tax=Nocardioides sp. TaxID=35761 RepID=UPI002623EFB8|nr:glycosyltransferase family A protein [Nocardioides sp.]
MKLSLIIPTYNRTNLLNRAVSSVLAQVSDRHEIEVLVCDDASSSAAALELLDYYENSLSKHYPISVHRLEENSGGASAPRNLGLEVATGDYVLFMDSDDWLGSQAISKIFEFARRVPADEIAINMASDDGRAGISRWAATVESANRFQALSTLTPLKLFRTELINKLNLRFDPDLVVNEDFLFVFSFVVNAESYAFLADYDYYHVSHRVTEGQGAEFGHLTVHASADERRATMVESQINAIDKMLTALARCPLPVQEKLRICRKVLLYRAFKIMSIPYGIEVQVKNGQEALRRRLHEVFTRHAAVLLHAAGEANPTDPLAPEHTALLEAIIGNDFDRVRALV